MRIVIFVATVILLIGIAACIEQVPADDPGPVCGDGVCDAEEDCSVDCGSNATDPTVFEIGSGNGLSVVADDRASEGSAAFVSSIDSHDTGLAADGFVYVRVFGPSGSQDAVVLVAGNTSDRVFPSQWSSYEWVEANVSGDPVVIEGAELDVRLDVIVVSGDPLNASELDDLVGVESYTRSQERNESSELVRKRGEYDLRADPNFNVSQLSSEQRLWYDRMWNAIDSGRMIGLASEDDTYDYGRSLNLDMTTLLLAFRTTGDLELLDSMDAVMETMRAELRDEWCAPSEPRREDPSGDSDGYVGWVWRQSDGTIYTCRDEHEMDEMMTHGWIAQMAYVYHVNRDLTSPSGIDYAERADFWHDYLKNHFEAKWRARSGRETGYPFLDRPLTHPVLNFVRYHYYMHKITGDAGYLAEAQRLTHAFESSATAIENTPQGEAYVWCHIVPDFSRCYSVQPSNYARYTLSSIHDLMIDGFEPFNDTVKRDRYTRTISHFLIDDETRSTETFAPDVYGGGTHEWMPMSGRAKDGTRLIPGQFTSNFVYAPYDETGEILEFAELTLDWTDSVSAPRNVEIPAAMVYYHSLR